MKKIKSIIATLLLIASLASIFTVNVLATEEDEGWLWPVPAVAVGELTSGWGWRNFNGGEFHQGIDIGGRYHDVVATRSGTVSRAFSCSHGNDCRTCHPLGNHMKIEHEINGTIYTSVYAHLLSDIRFVMHDPISQGDVIGRSGNSGFSFGSHLHFEIWNRCFNDRARPGTGTRQNAGNINTNPHTRDPGGIQYIVEPRQQQSPTQSPQDPSVSDPSTQVNNFNRITNGQMRFIARSNAPIRATPYGNGNALCSRSQGSMLTVSGVGTNTHGNRWYWIEASNGWVYSGNLIGNFSWTGEQQRTISRAGAPIRQTPYARENVIRNNTRVGDRITVNGITTNTHGNRWYSIQGGGWIYGGNISAVRIQQISTPAPVSNNVTLRENQGRSTGTTSETVFQLRASTDFDATRVVITFSGGGQFNMNRTNARAWYLNTRLTVAGAQTITVHAYNGNTRLSSDSIVISTTVR